MNGQPKAPFYVALFLVVAGLLAFAVYRSDIFAPKGKVHEGTGAIDPNALGQTAERQRFGAVTTVKEYTFKPAERLPEVKGTSAYKPLKDNTVRFALNVWAGWGPIILANDGFKPGKVWKTADGEEFKVELVLIDNPVAMRDAYAPAKSTSAGPRSTWCRCSWKALSTRRASRAIAASCRAFTSRSTGRTAATASWPANTIKTVSDLRGKKVVLAQNSPSHYFLLNMLVSGGVQPSEVNMVFTDDAFQAAAAFNAEKDAGRGRVVGRPTFTIWPM